GTVTYTLRVTNSSGYAIVLMDDFQDTLPAGAAYVNNSSTFNGSAISNPSVSGQVLTWSSPFSIGASSSAALVFQATLPATPGLYTTSAIAHIGSVVIDTTYSTSDNAPATVQTRVLLAPTIAKSFSPVATGAGGSLTLTLTLANPNPGTALTGLAVTDTYPAGLVNAATPGAATTCPSGALSGGVAGGTTIGASGGTPPAGPRRTGTVEGTSAPAAPRANTTG